MTVLALVLAATLSAGNAEFDDGARRGACDIALRRLQAETIERGLADGVLKTEMLADPAGYAKAEEARLRCRETYATALHRQYCEAAAAIAQQLGVTGDVTTAAARTVAQAVDARFETAFAAERAAAVSEQAQQIAGEVRPAEEDFESKDEAVLRREMTERVVAGQKNPVFEENRQYISEQIVDPVMKDAFREMKRQREYLSRTKCEAYAPEEMAREIEANLRRNVADRQVKSGNPATAWGVFPGVVRTDLPRVVERRVTGLVMRCVDDVPLTVTSADVLEKMSLEPAAHCKAADSEKVFCSAYAAQLLGAAIDKAEREAPEKERSAFASYVRAHAAAPELAKAVEARLKRDVLPTWRKVRAEVAKAEAARLWPTLADRTWYPDARLADRFVARSDYATAIRAWRKTPELAALARAGGGRTLLEETAADADQSVSAAFDLARNAIAAQNELVDEAAPEVLGDAKERKASFWRRTPDLKAIVNLLTEAVEEKWDDRRERILWGDGKRPSNADDQHAELFPSVRKRIELVARSILEEMRKEDPEDPKPEEPVQTMFSIVVERDGEQVNVKLEKGGEAVAERRAKARMSDYRKAMKDVSDKLGTDILKLK